MYKASSLSNGAIHQLTWMPLATYKRLITEVCEVCKLLDMFVSLSGTCWWGSLHDASVYAQAPVLEDVQGNVLSKRWAI